MMELVGLLNWLGVRVYLAADFLERFAVARCKFSRCQNLLDYLRTPSKASNLDIRPNKKTPVDRTRPHLFFIFNFF